MVAVIFVERNATPFEEHKQITHRCEKKETSGPAEDVAEHAWEVTAEELNHTHPIFKVQIDSVFIQKSFVIVSYGRFICKIRNHMTLVLWYFK